MLGEFNVFFTKLKYIHTLCMCVYLHIILCLREHAPNSFNEAD